MTEFICSHRLPVRVGSAFTSDQCRVCWVKSGGDRNAPLGKEPVKCGPVQTVEFKITRPCHARHPSIENHPSCLICIRWENDEAFRKSWEQYLEETKNKPIPCQHRGPLVSGSDRHKYQLTLLKDWYTCKKGFGENGFVCSCQGCNVLCIGYEMPEDPSCLG